MRLWLMDQDLAYKYPSNQFVNVGRHILIKYGQLIGLKIDAEQKNKK